MAPVPKHRNPGVTGVTAGSQPVAETAVPIATAAHGLAPSRRGSQGRGRGRRPRCSRAKSLACWSWGAPSQTVGTFVRSGHASLLAQLQTPPSAGCGAAGIKPAELRWQSGRATGPSVAVESGLAAEMVALTGGSCAGSIAGGTLPLGPAGANKPPFGCLRFPVLRDVPGGRAWGMSPGNVPGGLAGIS